MHEVVNYGNATDRTFVTAEEVVQGGGNATRAFAATIQLPSQVGLWILEVPSHIASLQRAT